MQYYLESTLAPDAPYQHYFNTKAEALAFLNGDVITSSEAN